MTFEELQAMIDSKNINVEELAETVLDTATYYGRVFARTGGLSEAVAEAVREQENENTDGAGANSAGGFGKEPFAFNPIICDGIDNCKTALLRANKGLLPNNFIEGMVCSDGCIGGAACLTHGSANKRDIDNHGKMASHKELKDASYQI